MNAGANFKEQRLLELAIEKLANTTGVGVEILAQDQPIGTGRQLDALVGVAAGTGRVTYAVEIKKALTTATVGLAVQHLKAAPHKGMIITDYVNPNMAERLKAMDVAFIDLAGNAYLNEPPTYIYIKGNRPQGRKALGPELKPTRAFQATGLQVMFGLLTHPGLVHAPYREIAAKTGVALGTVGWVFTDLRDHGFIYEKEGRQRQLIRKQEIIEAWVAAFPMKLRPKLRLGRYQAPIPDWWQRVDLGTFQAQWGGEIAGARLTDYLIPERAVIYANDVPARLLVEHRLKADPEGDVEVLRRFWQPAALEAVEGKDEVPPDIVPPLLVYADLVATADDRNVETAKRVYERFLDGHLG